MEIRTCQKCGIDNCSSDSSNEWECCNCKQIMIKKEVVEDKCKLLVK